MQPVASLPEVHSTGVTRRRVLGVNFLVGQPDAVVREIQAHGGCVVVPAASALVGLQEDPGYRDALVRADFAITDSGGMVLAWLLCHREKLTRVSGLRYLQHLLKVPALHQPGAVFLILPSEAARDKALAWLPQHGIPVTADDCYVAPFYGRNPIDDPRLLGLLAQRRPANIIVGIGGGVQERLGMYLRDGLGYVPAIHCIGAALGFLTGDQKPIPDLVDRLYLGWLLRWCVQPRAHAGRVKKSFRLPGLIARYGATLPPLLTDSAR